MKLSEKLKEEYFKEKSTGISTFMPGSQISSRPLKDINHLMNTEIKAKIIKIDLREGIYVHQESYRQMLLPLIKKKFFKIQSWRYSRKLYL